MNNQHTFTREIELPNGLEEVEFTAQMVFENSGIGHYEYWGSKCYDAGENYWCMEDAKWQVEDFTQEENQIINDYLGDNWEEIDTAESEIFGRGYEPNFDID